MKILNVSTAAATMLLLALTPAFARNQPIAEAREITLDACPAPVREAVNRALKNGKVDEVHRVTRDGKTFYTAEIDMPDDRDVKLWVRPDGEVTKTVTDFQLKDAPEPVRATLEKLAVNGARVEDVEQRVEGAVTTWRAEIDREGAPDLKVEVAPDGGVLEQREERAD